MATYYLVHGAYHGAWCWERLVPRLEAAGHRVVAPDLPGHGGDATPAAGVTMEAYVERVADLVGAADVPPVLVGHSMAGAVVSGVAERVPDRVARLVYLTAYMPAAGDSVSALARADADSLVQARVEIVDGTRCAVIDDAVFRAAFYHDASDADFARARERVRPQPLAPFQAAARITPEHWGRVPRLYVHCDDDRAISPACQARMVAALPGTPTRSLRAGHSPFVMVPEALAALLGDL